MRGVSSIILLAFATRALAEYEQDRYTKNLADKFLDELDSRAFQTSPINAALDHSALGKAAQIAPSAGSTAVRSNLRPLLPIGAQASSSSPSRACSCPAQPAMRRGLGGSAPLAVLSSQAAQRAQSSIQTHALPVTARAEASPERTYVMVKPDGVQRGLVGEIISRFESKGFTMKGLKLFSCPEDLAKEHYGDLSAKPFFQDLVDYICSGPVVAMVWEGKGVVKSARKLIGATNPLESEPGTIRGDFAVEVGRNVIHGSDSIENGEREIKLWFSTGEGMAEWTPAMEPWLRE